MPSRRGSDAFVWYNKNVQKLFEIVVPDHSILLFQDIASICPRTNIRTTKMKNTNRRRTSPETPYLSLASGASNRWVSSIKRGRCLERRLWCDDILGGIYLGDILFAAKIDVFLFAPRLGPDRSVKALGTYHFWQHIGQWLFCHPSDTRHASGNHRYTSWEDAVLLEPRIRYQCIGCFDSTISYYTFPDTFDERMKWSRWGTYLPAIRTVFRKLIFIYLSDAYALIVPLTSQETTHELFCAWWSHSSLNYRTPGWNSQSRLVATALAWSPQWCTYLLIIQGSSWTFRFFVKDRHGVNLDTNSETFSPSRRPFWGSILLFLTFTITINQCLYNYTNEI